MAPEGVEVTEIDPVAATMFTVTVNVPLPPFELIEISHV